MNQLKTLTVVEPTIELYCDLALFLVEQNCVGGVISFSHHDVGVELRTGSW